MSKLTIRKNLTAQNSQCVTSKDKVLKQTYSGNIFSQKSSSLRKANLKGSTEDRETMLK